MDTQIRRSRARVLKSLSNTDPLGMLPIVRLTGRGAQMSDGAGTSSSALCDQHSSFLGPSFAVHERLRGVLDRCGARCRGRQLLGPSALAAQRQRVRGHPAASTPSAMGGRIPVSHAPVRTYSSQLPGCRRRPTGTVQPDDRHYRPDGAKTSSRRVDHRIAEVRHLGDLGGNGLHLAADATLTSEGSARRPRDAQSHL